jgi:hypothetical protein
VLRRLITVAVAALAVLLCSAAGASELHVARSVVTPIDSADGWLSDFHDVYERETIHYVAELEGPNASERPEFRYVWYLDGARVLDFSARHLIELPGRTTAYVHPGHLKPGSAQVELYVDGELADTHQFTVLAGARQTEDQVSSDISASALRLLLDNDIAGFDALATQYRSSQARTPAGEFKLSRLYHSIKTLNNWGPQDAKWQKLEEHTRRWQEDMPESPTAVVALAKVLFNRSWACRDMDRSVNGASGGMSDFLRLLEEARAVLDRHFAVGDIDPEWHVMRIAVATSQGVGPSEVYSRAETALRRWPYYYGIHFAAVNGLSPEWGGSEEWIRKYVALAVERSRAKEATQAYFRIYGDVARRAATPVDALNRAGAKGPAMWQSIQDTLAAYPDPYNRELARGILCLGGYFAQYRQLGRRAGEVVTSYAPWDTALQRQSCDEWAIDGKPVPRPPNPVVYVSNFWSFLVGMGEDYWRPVRLGALAVVLITELMLRIAVWRRPAGPADLSRDREHALFSPAWYPRVYLRAWGPDAVSTAFAIRVAVFFGAAAWAITTIPSTDWAVTAVIEGLILSVALAAALLVLQRVAGRVTLRAEAIELSGALGSQRIERRSIRGVHGAAEAGPADGLNLELYAPLSSPVHVWAVQGADEAWRRWFVSLPTLNAHGQVERG